MIDHAIQKFKSLKFTGLDQGAMKKIAGLLASYTSRGDVLTLQGDLGAGKTTFARFFLEALGVTGDITSPTFPIVISYPLPDLTVYHFDLYRIKSSEELYEIGLDEALSQGVTLIEWPQIAKNHLPTSSLYIEIVIGQHELRDLIFYSKDQQSPWITRLKTFSINQDSPPIK